MKKKYLTAAALTGVLGVALAGLTACSNGSSADGGTETIVFQNQFSDAESAEAEKLVAEYEADNPGVEITLQRDNDASYYDKLVTQITAGKGPDIVRLEPPKVSQYASSGFLAPIDEALGDDADYFANTLEAARLDGKTYGLPQDVSTLALFYRTDLLAAAGIQTPPATWDELKTDAVKLTGNGKYGIGLFGGWGAYEFYPWLWQAGAEVVNDDGTKAVFDSPEGVDALTFWTDLQATAMPPGMASATEDDVRGPFVNGDIAMFTSGPYMASTLTEAGLTPEQWGVAPLPKGKDEASVLGGMDLAVLQNSQHKEAAIDFLAWFGSDDVQTTWASDLGYVPAKKSLYEAAPFSTDPNTVTFGEIIENSRSRPTITRAADVDGALGDAVAAGLSGSSSPADAMKAAAEKANAAING
ncbi:sugar ABC transporter substrate-binding protein [Herbiconiux sp. VKM Ac-1786]|jgi:ABC-type glycerol-3-phosphate transport system substrate-binding protein|uniref:sugar ABC transporter substrate-binding protein n=1 Tax=Herbiconiux sp. VKM Ac-1786 TaxID=2783824 RepID=UPI00188A26FC|nr:sugar ABC transporter substrate-binding protein [Herbiconiux sp. VKM Ac-1786]MBF4571808.1 sugar ABC transporter substrate-binding protein [Herbiconiux sp. VKM Ac-1786]